MTQAAEHFDILIVGAGLSGIGAACTLSQEHPHKTIGILESRGATGGTWDLFRYPGVRADSDLYTFGYGFRPWSGPQAIAEGSAILQYIRETADEYGVNDLIRFNQRMVAADWSSRHAHWRVTVERTATPVGRGSDLGHGTAGPPVRGPAAASATSEPSGTGECLELTASWLFNATGYYRYDTPNEPDIRGLRHFAGAVVHPQLWPRDMAVAGKNVVVIGSGATAVSLLPALVERGADVTMVQRTPSYIIPVPTQNRLAKALKPRLGEERTAHVARAVATRQQRLLWRTSKIAPHLVKGAIAAVNKTQLPDDVSVKEHFNPPYKPWDQRVCVAPGGDFYRALKSERGHVITGAIAEITKSGVRMANGQEIAADVLITATGFNVLLFGGARFSVDGAPVDLTEKIAYRGAMLSDLPNFAFAIGYTNASWTLKIGLLVDWFSRLLAHMDGIGATSVRPVAPEGLPTKPLLDFDAGYVQRALDRLPQQGTRSPWLMSMSYLADRRELRSRPVVDEFLRFDDAAAPVLEELPALLTGPRDTGVEHIVDLGEGRSMCVRVNGPEDGPVVILITGLAFDLTAWPISFLKSLVMEGCRVVRIDNRDEGRSFRATSKTPSVRQLLSGDLPEGQYTVEDMSEDVADTMRALGVDRADVIGFSLGGMIAQSLAAHHPELVRRLVSLCSTTGDPEVGTTATSTAAMLMLPGAPNRSVYIRGRVIIGRHLAGPGYPIDEAYEAQLAAAHWDRSLDPHGESAAMRRQIGAIRASGNRAEVLAHITAPTLVIHGDKDKIVRPDGGPATADAIPGATFIEIPGMGHQLHPALMPTLLGYINEHLVAAEQRPTS